jgi:hypothetical protein
MRDPITRGAMMMRRVKLKRFAAGFALIAAACLLISNLPNFEALTVPDLDNLGDAPARDPLEQVAARYAPFIYQATDKKRGRQDLISNIDFDGDLVGNNNWENFDRRRLKPTVYYAALETETHYFVAYHLYHPRDWNRFTLWLNDTHENDGENLQVVARKSDGRVVLLWTQAHYKSWVYTNPGTDINGGSVPIEAPLQVVDSDGNLSEDGQHAAVFVEAEGHGIYGSMDSSSGVKLKNDGYVFDGGSGLLLRPKRDGETVFEPASTVSGEVPYQLDSITMKLWPLLRDGKLTGDGRLLDGSYPYRDNLVDIKETPRFYDGNRFSGPFGPDRGISPFALDFKFERGTLGALFFNPAARYAENLSVEGRWSTDYINYPFR